MVSKLFRGLTSDGKLSINMTPSSLNCKKISVVHVCLNYIGLIHSKERLYIAAAVMNQEKIK